MTMEAFRNWPNGGALELDAKPKDGEGIVAGMFIKLNTADGEWILATGADNEKAAFALQNQSDNDVVEAQKLPAILGNMIAGTDQYVPGSYTLDLELQVDPANHGKLKAHAGGALTPVVAISKGIVERDGISFLKIQIP